MRQVHLQVPRGYGERVAEAPRGANALNMIRFEAEGSEQALEVVIANISIRSPIEIFPGGLQSIGSWRGFLGYALAAGIVVWVGLLTGTTYLLVAAMLIAPFAGPAMNVEADLELTRESLTSVLQQPLLDRWPSVTPLVPVTLMQPLQPAAGLR